MRILVIGQCYGYLASGFASGHSVESRDLGLARGLAKLGNKVDIIATTKGMTDDGLIFRISWEMANPLSKYDAILLCESIGLGRIEAQPDLYKQMLAHPCVVGAMEWLDEMPACVKAIGLTTPQLVVEYKKTFPGRTAFYLPWGCNKLPVYPDPWPDHSVKRVVFIGCIHEQNIEKINMLAVGLEGRCELWIGSLFTLKIGVSNPPGITREERDKLMHRKVHFISDLLPPSPWPVYGPIFYEDTFRFIQHADCALNLSVAPNMTQQHGKIWDYLGCGCPVVSEFGNPTNNLIEMLGAGRIVPWGDEYSLSAALAGACNTKYDRDRIRRTMQGSFSWDESARILDSRIREVRR